MTPTTWTQRAGTVLTVLIAASLIGSTPAAAQQSNKVLAQQSMSVATEKQVMMKLRENKVTPLTNKFSAGEVVTTDEEIKCFKKKSGGLVQVKCPDVMIVTTK